MSNPEKSTKKAPLNVVQRTERLEQVHDALVGQIQQSFGRIDQQFAKNSELLAAIVEIVGEETIVAKINERQAARDAKAAAEAEAGVKALLDKGTLVRVETIGEETLIVGRDVDADGKVLGPGRAQVAFKDLKPEFREKLKGGKVGSKVVTSEDEDKGVTQTFEVTELYELAPDKDETDNKPATATPEA